MKFSFDSLLQGLRSERQDVEVGQQLAPFTGMDKPAQNNVADTTASQEVIDGFQLAPDDGVTVVPTPITLGEDVTVEYNGLLSQHGAQELFLHCGFGPGPWTRIQDIPMRKTNDGAWVAKISQVVGEQFSFCFYDNANNWDNNNGRDWQFVVHSG